MMRRSWRAPAAAIWAYSGVALAAAVAAVVALRLWQADLRVPFSYRGDALFFAMMVKAVVDHGWYLTNAQLGAPGVLALHDFPQADAVHLAAVKVMSLLSHDWALLFNLYFLLGFPLIALSAFAVFRQFRIASGPALAAALLYAFQPSRLIMGESHFFLTAFWQVPLAILVVLWVAGDEPPLFAPGARAWRPRLALRNRRSIAAVAIALLVSGTGVYYAFFTGVLIVVAGALGAIERRSPRHALAGVALTGLIVLGLGVQSIPTLLYRRAMGPNPAVAARPVGEAETFGLKIAPLLLPVGGHRVPALAAITDRYERATAARSELSSTSLGLVGAIGFLVLLGTLFRRANPAADPVVLSGGPPPLLPGLARLARLNLAALLLATTGGFGALFALLASPLIRAYARMHVFIAFFALFAIAALLDRIWRTRPRAGLLLTAAVAFGGVADQVPARVAPSYARQRRDYRADAAFVHGLEAQLRPGAQIFQLPYLRFPESGGLPGTRLGDYDPLRPYLHARALRWSYPTMFGRSGDAWTSGVADEPVPELVRTLSDAGFDGILVDCRGYPDDGAEIVAALSVALGPDPTTRATDRYVFFDLAAAKERALAGLDQDERDRRRQEALDRPVLRWLDGFFAPEHDKDGFFRWCGGDCTLEIANPGARGARGAL
jgi:phosphoglycerol transferase